MKNQTLRLSLFLLVLLTLGASHVKGQSSVDKELWQDLQQVAQEIGLCVYMSAMPDDQCKCLQNNGQRSFMAPLNKGWARTKMIKWMRTREQLSSNAILIYDKYTNTANEGGELAKGYFIISLQELGKVEYKSRNSSYEINFPSKGQKKAIFNNTYAREFYQKKDGRVLDKGQWIFNVSNEEKVKQFIQLLNQIAGN